MKIYYFGPDNDRPSWGLGMIYYHVWLLNKNNFDAKLIHQKKSFRVSWLKLDVPIVYLEDQNFFIDKNDILIIPELHASDKWFAKLNCHKTVFVQNAFYLFDGLQGKTYEELGFNSVFYYLPHLRKLLNSLTKLPLYETPPFIAPYYYVENVIKTRRKTILVYPKFENKDYKILLYLLRNKLNIKPKNILEKVFSFRDDWELIELKNLNHQEVAEQMQNATFFISLNTTEAFNSAVPEAMAAGCINICYDGIGPRDFLKNEENAFVFPNNDIFNLSEKLIDLVRNFHENIKILKSIQKNGLSLSLNYSIYNLEKSLINYFDSLRSKLSC